MQMGSHQSMQPKSEVDIAAEGDSHDVASPAIPLHLSPGGEITKLSHQIKEVETSLTRARSTSSTTSIRPPRNRPQDLLAEEACPQRCSF